MGDQSVTFNGMKVHRFIGDFDTDSPSHIIKEESIVHQIARVLKLSPGEQVIVGRGDGKEALCNIIEVEKDLVTLGMCERRENDSEPKNAVVLCLALLKKDNFELALQKAIEVGAKEVVPLITERTVKQGFVRARLEKIVREAVEQSGRGVIPSLEEPLTFKDALFRANRMGTVFFCDPEAPMISSAGVRVKGTSYLFVGPEGGWTDTEREMAREIEAVFISLGRSTLRAETAATVATYLFSSYL